MSHNRAPKKGSKWYLPYNTYQTVVNFCYSYKELMQKLADLDGQHSHEQDGMPRGTNTGDPTAAEAMRRLAVEKKIRLIENSVDATAPDMRWWLMLGVTHRGMTYKYLHTKLGMPCNKNEYSELRREVYWRVAERIM